MDEITFEPPGPGLWRLNKTHFSGPVSQYYQEICPPAQLDGFQEGADHYGYLYDRGIKFVNEFRYDCFRSIVGTSEASSQAETKFQRRIERLAETYETKRWRDDLERWDTEWKPAHHETNQSLQSVDLTDLNNDELLEHLGDCRQAVADGEALHVRMSFTSGIPQYDFLHYTSNWTSRSPHQLLSLLDGASPDSAGAIDELQQVVVKIKDTPFALDVVRSDESSEAIVEQLRNAGGAVESAMNDWLGVVGYRPISGWDLTDPYALEHPKTLVRTLRKALDNRSEASGNPDSHDQLTAVRQEVPREYRNRFDEFYEEARVTYRVRDERNFLSGPSRGLLRRTLVEVGRRLKARGRLRAPDHALDFTHEELVAALSGEQAPTAKEVAARVEYRRSHDNSDAPDQLGDGITDLSAERDLPDPVRRFVNGVQAYRQANYPDTTDDSVGPMTVRGLGASPGTAEGPAQVVSGPADFPAIQDGDILVTDKMSPGYNVILPLLRGVVTDTGGKLSHPAIVAREYGLPAVVGCEDATTRIGDGDRITIDGESGTVQLL